MYFDKNLQSAELHNKSFFTEDAETRLLHSASGCIAAKKSIKIRCLIAEQCLLGGLFNVKRKLDCIRARCQLLRHR